jgi:RNA recognition motif-containing protein
MTAKIYVGNIPYSVNDPELHDLFAQFGKVESTRIVTDRYSGKSRGFAFVEMANFSEAKQAIGELNGTEFQGRRIKVSEAHPKKDANRRNSDFRSQRFNKRSSYRESGYRKNF